MCAQVRPIEFASFVFTTPEITPIGLEQKFVAFFYLKIVYTIFSSKMNKI